MHYMAEARPTNKKGKQADSRPMTALTAAPVWWYPLPERMIMKSRTGGGFLGRRHGAIMLALLIPALFGQPLFPVSRDAVDVTGVWDMTLQSQEGTAHPTITLNQAGEKITGIYEGKIGSSKVTGTIQGNDIKFTVSLKFQDVTYSVSYAGTVSGDSMKGTTRFGNGGTGTWSARKRSSPF